MKEAIQTEKYRGHDINVYQDEEGFDPRKDDNLGTMICFHSNCSLGDKHGYNDLSDMLLSILQDYYDYEYLERQGRDKLIKLFEKDHIVLPLYLYNHSGITINTSGFSCPWDGGRIGVIYVSLAAVKKEYGYKRISSKIRQKVIEVLKSEVKIYDSYISGEVYGYTIEPQEQNRGINCQDSCWNFLGYDELNDLIEEAKSSIDYAIKEYKEKIKQEYKKRLSMTLFMRTCWAD